MRDGLKRCFHFNLSPSKLTRILSRLRVFSDSEVDVSFSYYFNLNKKKVLTIETKRKMMTFEVEQGRLKQRNRTGANFITIARN